MPQLFATTQTTIRGTISRVMFSDNGYTIARINLSPESLKDDDGKRRPPTMSILGAMDGPKLGQEYEFVGNVTHNAKFNCDELRFDNYRTIMPDDYQGIARYLMDTAKWVGPSTCRKIMDRWGDKALETIRDTPEEVIAAEIPGLTPERVREMSDSLQASAATEQVRVALAGMFAGIIPTHGRVIQQCLKFWGCDAPDRLRENPYILQRCRGVGFQTADVLATRIGVDAGSLMRHRAIVEYLTKRRTSECGSTIVPAKQLAIDANAQALAQTLHPDALASAAEDGIIHINGDLVSPRILADAEQLIAQKIQSMMAAAVRPARLYPEINADGLAVDQAAAVQIFREAPIFSLVGAPGTGKTYTVARILRSLLASGVSVSAAAPTGKAAKQMAQALGNVGSISPSTIHRLLEPAFDEETGEFTFNRGPGNPINSDLVVIDETSMVDVSLMSHLLAALRQETRLLIVGDHYQLPSVGPGAVLRDMLIAGVPHHELTEIKRNAGRIVKACHQIKDGVNPEPSPQIDLDAGENWRHIDAADDASISQIIEILYREKLSGFVGSLLWDAQVISPVNESGVLSCRALNAMLRPILNPTMNPKGMDVGDKVVQTVNTQAKGVHEAPWTDKSTHLMELRDRSAVNVQIVNGDLGQIVATDEKRLCVHFMWPSRTVVMPRSDASLKMAYCMTCHKMQGSECPVIVLPLAKGFTGMPHVTREWLYTAFSRAKQMLITVGRSDVSRIIAKVGTGQRLTSLATKLAGIAELLGKEAESAQDVFNL